MFVSVISSFYTVADSDSSQLVADTVNTDPMSMLEMALAITVVALPGLQPLVGRSTTRSSSLEDAHETFSQK